MVVCVVCVCGGVFVVCRWWYVSVAVCVVCVTDGCICGVCQWWYVCLWLEALHNLGRLWVVPRWVDIVYLCIVSLVTRVVFKKFDCFSSGLLSLSLLSISLPLISPSSYCCSALLLSTDLSILFCLFLSQILLALLKRILLSILLNRTGAFVLPSAFASAALGSLHHLYITFLSVAELLAPVPPHASRVSARMWLTSLPLGSLHNLYITFLSGAEVLAPVPPHASRVSARMWLTSLPLGSLHHLYITFLQWLSCWLLCHLMLLESLLECDWQVCLWAPSTIYILHFSQWLSCWLLCHFMLLESLLECDWQVGIYTAIHWACS